MNRSYTSIIISFAFLLPLQVLVFRNFVLYDTGFNFFYLFCLLLLPVEMSAILGMVIAFATGLTVDLFYHTIGVHAASAVLMMFLRFYWLRINGPRSGYEVNQLPTIPNYGFGWYITYALPLVLIHSCTVFLLEAGQRSLFGQSLLRGLITAIISFIFIVLTQYFFFKKAR
jgi:hypothetical protein